MNTLPKMTKAERANLEARFFSKADKNGPTVYPHLGPCWLWTAYKNRGGYGHFGVDGVIELSHRVSWMLAEGTVPAGLWIRHTCNVPACVNPFHLSPGEPIDNSFDMHSQGRGKGTYGSGEAHPKAKLTVEKVRQIRDLYLTGNFTLVEIGQKFGVEEGGVRKILTGRYWNGLGRVSAKDYARTKHLHMKGMNNGEDCSNAKLKAIQIPEILARSEAGETYASIGRALGVHPATIWSIVHGKTWSSVSGVKQP